MNIRNFIDEENPFASEAEDSVPSATLIIDTAGDFVIEASGGGDNIDAGAVVIDRGDDDVLDDERWNTLDESGDAGDLTMTPRSSLTVFIDSLRNRPLLSLGLALAGAGIITVGAIGVARKLRHTRNAQ